MKGRLPLLLLLASALTFLASLFLPWRETSVPPFAGRLSVQGLLLLFEGGNVDGWIGGTGDVAVLLVVALVVATVTALRRPRLAVKLPLCSLGLALGYFAAAVALEVHTESRLVGFTGHPQTAHTGWSYGFYLGLASGAVTALSGLALRWSEFRLPRRTADGIAALLGIALLISFFLPWTGFRAPSTISYSGIESAPAVIAALGLILGAWRLHGGAARRWRLPLAIGTAILTGAAASAVEYFDVHRYGTWIGVGCAVSLVALEAVRAWPARLPALPHGLLAVRVSASALLIVALFLPWEEIHGRALANGWSSVAGAAAGGLCLLLLATPALPALEDHVLDAVVAVVLLVSAAGTAFREDQFVLRGGEGAFVGFAAAGILLVTALVRVRPGRIERKGAVARAVPLAASVLCVVAIVLPLWFVLPRDWTYQATPFYYDSWLSVGGLFLALYLVRLWATQVGGPVRTGGVLTLVPLTLLTLPALELIRFRNGEVIWSAVILVGLCLLLALLGWIEEKSGLQSVRVPDAWRIDRLPEPES